jgi:hypothetical protein
MGRHQVRWMFHSTAMVADYDLAVRRLQTLAGLRVMEYGEEHQPEIGRRGGMTWVGDNSIEIGQPIVEGAGAARFVARHGGGMHSVALQVADLDATIDHIQSCGVRVAARPMPDMCFTDPRDTGGIFLEWAALEIDEDPRFGADLPPFAVPPVLDVRQQGFTGAIVDDPLRLAHTLAELFATDVTFEDPGAGPGSPRAGVSLRDGTLALYPLAPEDSEALWGRPYDRARTHLMAVRVEDLAGARQSLAQQGFPVARADDSIVVIDPAATGDVQVALVDHLLPGDPRLAG